MGILEVEEGEDQDGERLHLTIRIPNPNLGGLDFGLGRLEELLRVMLWGGDRIATAVLAQVHGDWGLLVRRGPPRHPTQSRALVSDLQGDAESTLLSMTK